MDDNKSYNICLPEDDEIMFNKFKNVITEMNNFTFDGFEQNNRLKCEKCIYEPLCSFSALKGEINDNRT